MVPSLTLLSRFRISISFKIILPPLVPSPSSNTIFSKRLSSQFYRSVDVASSGESFLIFPSSYADVILPLFLTSLPPLSDSSPLSKQFPAIIPTFPEGIWRLSFFFLYVCAPPPFLPKPPCKMFFFFLLTACTTSASSTGFPGLPPVFLS